MSEKPSETASEKPLPHLNVTEKLNVSENLDVLREQLAQLHSLRDGGALDEASFQAAREPLEKRIVQAVMAGAKGDALAASAPADSAANVQKKGAALPVAEAPVRTPRSLWLKAGAFVAVVALAGYSWKGSPQGDGSAPAGFEANGAAAAPEAGASAPRTVSREQIETLVAKLEARLKETPGDAEGWAMLGRTRMGLGQPTEAVAAYQTALQLRPDDAPTLADAADAVASSQGSQPNGEAAQLIARALQIDPNNLKALALAGSLAFNQGDDVTAVKHWDRALKVAPADSPLAEMVRGAAQEARERSKLPPATATSTATAAVSLLDIAKGAGGAGAAVAAGQAAAPATGAGGATPQASAATAPATAISGTVKLAAALQGKASAEDTVFIFARNAEGGGMPLAILRKQVKDLPLAFTLDDSLAMSPAARISGAKQLVVTARVSKSGQAAPASGDLEGVSAPVAPGARDLQLEIGSVRP
jgi:cytochrome c-type biogenesis protein CcmH